MRGSPGLTAAHVLARTADVVLLEADTRLGGHAHTHEIASPNGRLAIDSGFIVHNQRTYPTFLRLLDDLGVATAPTEMSMSVTCRERPVVCRWAGSRRHPRPAGTAGRPRFARLLGQVPRFHRMARRSLRGDLGDLTWGSSSPGAGSRRISSPISPPPSLPACGAPGAEAAAYPARHLFRFLDHHGMLSVTGSPTWRTIVGGSARYVEALAAQLPDVRTHAPVVAIERHDDGVGVRLAGGDLLEVDRVVLATHADDAAAILVDASSVEKAALTSIPYSRTRSCFTTTAGCCRGCPGRARVGTTPGRVAPPRSRWSGSTTG